MRHCHTCSVFWSPWPSWVVGMKVEASPDMGDDAERSQRAERWLGQGLPRLDQWLVSDFLVEVSSSIPLPLKVWSPDQQHQQHPETEMQISGPTPDLLKQNLHFKKIGQVICLHVKVWETWLWTRCVTSGWQSDGNLSPSQDASLYKT